jgi:hypothetical protein
VQTTLSKPNEFLIKYSRKQKKKPRNNTENNLN